MVSRGRYCNTPYSKHQNGNFCRYCRCQTTSATHGPWNGPRTVGVVCGWPAKVRFEGPGPRPDKHTVDNKCLQYVFTQKELNLRQRRWLGFLKDYDMNVLYHARLFLVDMSNGGVVVQNRKLFQKRLGTQVNLSTTFHPQVDIQVEHTIQILEDMFRACVIDFKGNRDDHLPLIEFPNNNNFHSSIHMAPYEAFYGRRCRSLVGWLEVGEKALVGLDSVHEVKEKVQLIRDRLKTT
ncbi:hypothetical protein MTR67_038824 [Solanum verrucosum]|uniref:Reverse transcriptase domain-containing protein n=1 Tax=Solanum verrucosum TaxID=315347 RepID=A0AAF0ZQK7_SOLVR|nr:hypothetical protein MTR67_038824 [Solanum verrucosum]